MTSFMLHQTSNPVTAPFPPVTAQTVTAQTVMKPVAMIWMQRESVQCAESTTDEKKE